MSSKVHYINFNQNEYVSYCFKLLDAQVLSMGGVLVREKNKYGYDIIYTEKYGVFSSFLTNFYELMDVKSADVVDGVLNFKEEHYTYSSLYDNDYDQCLFLQSLDKNSIKTGFADLDNLGIKEPKEFIYNPS